jgi:hypothetical protein
MNIKNNEEQNITKNMSGKYMYTLEGGEYHKNIISPELLIQCTMTSVKLTTLINEKHIKHKAYHYIHTAFISRGKSKKPMVKTPPVPLHSSQIPNKVTWN